MTSLFHQVPITHFIVLSCILFCIGVFGVLFRRNVIVIFMSVELMLNSVNLLLVAFSAYLNDPAGQIFVFFVMAVAAAEVAVGLAIITLIYRNQRTVDISQFKALRN